jgi:glycyl-tRNA synthetase beta chain
MSNELILEVGCEEIPARFVALALKQMEEKASALLTEARVGFEGLRTLGTPRRLTLTIASLAARQEDLEEVRTGPPERAAYRDGQPTKAAQGFARGQGVAVEDLFLADTPKGKYVAARVFEAGAPTADLLPELLSEVVSGLSFPKSMRWGARRDRFARPVRWIVALYGGEVVDFAFAGVSAGAQTVGHRFSAPDPITVTSIAQYAEALAAADVVVEPSERAAQIDALLATCGEEAGGEVIEDEELRDEVVQLIEKPHAVLVRFDERYLELPPEVLISSMRKHQRYFAIEAPEGGLRPACAVIYNTPVRDPDVVRAGNLRVLKARLEDAFFFFEQDRKSTLASLVDRLDEVVWVRELGTQRARTERVAALVGALGQRLGFDDDALADARRAALLSKSDLLTAMVAEFPDLQGVIGREYARHDGESEAVAVALREQYLPSGADDALPGTDVGAALALADRVDTLVGIFGIGSAPKGSNDKYALRRAALGALRIVAERGWGVTVGELIELALGVYAEAGALDAFKLGREQVADELDAFIGTRLRGILTAGAPVDVVEAVLAVTHGDVVGAHDRVAALAPLRDEPDMEPLSIGFSRVVNILRKQADAEVDIPAQIDAARLVEDAERALYDAYGEATGRVEAAVAERDWAGACRALIALRGPIDAFFDDVMVMADDEALKLNRLALLDALRGLFLQVADVSLIQV